MKWSQPNLKHILREEIITKTLHYSEKIERIDWESRYIILKIETAFSTFTKTIVSTFQKCFPLEIIKLNYENRNPLINQTLKYEIQIRDKLFVLSRKYPSLENKHGYKQFQNRNLNEQRKAERNYYTEQFELNKHDIKKSWKII